MAWAFFLTPAWTRERGAVLPTPQELRDQSQRLREAARHALDDATKRRLATDALVLAQLAEAIERNGGVEGAKAQRYERLLAEVLGEDAVRAPDAGQKVRADMHSQIRAWRDRAEELRTTRPVRAAFGAGFAQERRPQF
jgi:hypothetical protein